MHLWPLRHSNDNPRAGFALLQKCLIRTNVQTELYSSICCILASSELLDAANAVPKKRPRAPTKVMHKCIFSIYRKKNRNMKSNIQMVKHDNSLWGCHTFVDVPNYNGKTFLTKSALGWNCWSREVLDNVCRRVPQSAHKGFYFVSSKNEVTQEYET